MQTEMRIHRTPVTQNQKCDTCVHYDGNAASKGGACEVGTFPATCGTGMEMRFGYAPLDQLGPDQINDLAAPCLTGTPGAMNEMGQLEPQVKMKQVVLGDEHLTIAQRIKGDMGFVHKGMYPESQGQVSRFSPEGRADMPYGGNEAATTFEVAKALHGQHMSPRMQHKYSLDEVLMFLGANGFSVTDADVVKAREFDRARVQPRPPGVSLASTAQKKSPPRVKKTSGNKQVMVSALLGDKPKIEKAGGAGSRGGRVIGTTKSGKPVYGPSSSVVSSFEAWGHARRKQQATGRGSSEHLGVAAKEAAWKHAQSHSDFTSEDHNDARQVHRDQVSKLGLSHHASEGHARMAEAHRQHSAGENAHGMLNRKTKKGLGTPDVVKAGKGPGSRGGKIAYYTKSGKPVYQSAAKKNAPKFSEMAENWSKNAANSDSGDDHATAAKQHLAAAFYQHHADNHDAADNHYSRALDHHAKAKSRGGASKRTMSWIDKNVDATDKLVTSNRSQKVKAGTLHAKKPTPKVKKADAIEKAGGPGSRGGNVIGTTKSGKSVYGPSSAVSSAVEGSDMGSGMGVKEAAYKHAGSHEGFTSDDHKEAAQFHRGQMSRLGISNAGSMAHARMAEAHRQHASGKNSYGNKPSLKVKKASSI